MNVEALIYNAAVALVILSVAALGLWSWVKARRSAGGNASQNPTCVAHAEALRQNNQIKEARNLLLQAQRRQPHSSIIQYRLACYSSLLKEFAQARAHLKRACQLDRQWAAPAMYDPDLYSLRRAVHALQELETPASPPPAGSHVSSPR